MSSLFENNTFLELIKANILNVVVLSMSSLPLRRSFSYEQYLNFHK